MADKRLSLAERAELKVKVRELAAQGLSATEIGEKLGISHVSVGMYAADKVGRAVTNAKEASRAAAPRSTPSPAPAGDHEAALLRAELNYLRERNRILEAMVTARKG